MVTKLNRLGRSMEHLIELSRHLQSREVDLVVLDQGIDTSTAIGRLFFQIIGAIGEFEHALMSERTRDGLAAARARVSDPSNPSNKPSTVTYAYNSDHEIKSVTDNLTTNNVETASYQGVDGGPSCGGLTGDLCSITDFDGNKTSYSYNSAGS